MPFKRELPGKRSAQRAEDLYHFLGGRNRYNSVRKLRMELRRLELLGLWVDGELTETNKARVGQRFGVSRWTIGRDYKLLGIPLDGRYSKLEDLNRGREE